MQISEIFKQGGFYTDLDENPEISKLELEYPEADFKSVSARAEEAIPIVRSDDAIHQIAATVYESKLWPARNGVPGVKKLKKLLTEEFKK